MARDAEERPNGSVIVRGGVVLGLVLAASVVVLHPAVWPLVSEPSRIRAVVAELGPWGPVVSIAFSVAQVLAAPIPGQMVGLLNGYVYGVGLGFAYSMIGLAIGSALAMALARRFGRPLVERFASKANVETWDRLARRRGALFFFLVFLIPGLPDDLVCFLIGLSPLPLGRMLGLAVLGRAPGMLGACWTGAFAVELPLFAWGLAAIAMVALAFVAVRYGDRVEALAVRLVDRLEARLGRRRPGTESHD